MCSKQCTVFEKSKKILLEDVDFDSANQGFEISDAKNITLVNTNIKSSKKESVASGYNIMIRESSFENNNNALKLSNFSSVKILDSQLSKNKGTALHLVDITIARLNNNVFVENKVGLENHSFELIIQDTFLKNTLALDLSDSKGRIIDSSTYSENTKDKQEAA